MQFTAADDYDTDSMHDTGSNTTKLVAPIAGKYHITAGVQWSAEALSTTTLLLLRLDYNGAALAGGRLYFPPLSSLAVNGQGQSIGIDLMMAANDYVEAVVYFDAGASNRTIDRALSAFSMYYIGE